MTRSIPVVTVSSWTTPLLLQRRTPCGLRQVTVAWFLPTDNLLPSREQQLINCDTVDSGCNGELMDNASASAKKNAMLTASHSYIATKGTCMASTQGSVAEYKVVFTDGVHVLMSTVAQQSVPIAVATDQRSFQSYSSGVLTASRDMLYQLFGVGALAHRGLPPLFGGFVRDVPLAFPAPHLLPVRAVQVTATPWLRRQSLIEYTLMLR